MTLPGNGATPAGALLACALALAMGAGAAGSAREVTVVASEFEFSPSTIEVAPGQRLEITLKNEGVLSHNLKFADRDIGTPTIQSGAQQSVQIVFDEPGTYAFVCRVPGHRQAGMRGEVIVEP